MPFLQHKYLPYFILLVLSVPLFFLNVHNVHLWGDDFAQYIKEAQNIAAGKPFYQSSYVFNPYNTEYAPPAYPPGFPLLLAPVVKIWGLSIKPMCYFNCVIAASLLFVLYAYFRKHAGVVASVCMAVLISYSGLMIDLKQQVLSDVPCLLFISIYLLLRNNPVFSWQRIILLMLCATMAMLIRTQAVFLPLAEALFWLVSLLGDLIKRRKVSVQLFWKSPSVLIVAGSLLLYIVLSRTMFYTPASYTDFYGNFILVSLRHSLAAVFKENLSFLFLYLGGLFYYDTYNPLFKTLMLFIQNTAVVFVFIGFLVTVSKRISVDDIFFVLISLLIIFHIHTRSQRFILPIFPVVYLYCYQTAKVILPAITRINARLILVAVTLLILRIGYAYLKSTLTDPPDICIPREKEYKAFKYISEHVSDSDIIVFEKPRVIALYTNKKSMVYANRLSFERNKQIFDSLRVKYMLVADDFGSHLYQDYFAHVQQPIDSAHIADSYTLYKLR